VILLTHSNPKTLSRAIRCLRAKQLKAAICWRKLCAKQTGMGPTLYCTHGSSSSVPDAFTTDFYRATQSRSYASAVWES